MTCENGRGTSGPAKMLCGSAGRTVSLSHSTCRFKLVAEIEVRRNITKGFFVRSRKFLLVLVNLTLK